MRASVVIPTFRRQDRLKDAVASVVPQLRPDDELIVVAADPDELEPVTAILAESSLVRQVRAVSNGQRLLGGGARNLGWREAVGDVVLFLDDDDYFAPAKLSDHIAAHENEGADIVYSGVWYVFGAADIRERRALPVGEDMCASLTIDGFCPPTTSCASVRRAALEAVDGFDEGLPSYQDWELWYRLAKAGYRFASLPQPLTYFVQHMESRVSLNGEGRARAAALVLGKHGRSPELTGFFARERRHMVERAVVFGARRGEWDSVRAFGRSLADGTFSPFEWRPYWIAAKVTGNLARTLLPRSS